MGTSIAARSRDFEGRPQACLYNQNRNSLVPVKGTSLISKEGSRLKTFKSCIGVYILEKNAVITALATIAIATFTGTIWAINI
jgi:hypothetical protein